MTELTTTATRNAFMYTIGCQMNELDSELALGTLESGGLNVVDSASDAVVLVNTCSVREKVEEKAYSWLGRMKLLKRKNPELIIGVLGCMAQKEGKLIFRRAPYADIVAGTAHFTKVDKYVHQIRATGKRILAVGRYQEVETEKRFKARAYLWRTFRAQCAAVRRLAASK